MNYQYLKYMGREFYHQLAGLGGVFEKLFRVNAAMFHVKHTITPVPETKVYELGLGTGNKQLQGKLSQHRQHF
jgi:hypothetical protein